MLRRIAGLAGLPALLVSTVILVFSGAGVSAQESGSPMILPLDRAPLIVETGEGSRRFNVEIADEPEERRRGLMFRERLPENQGMLFVFEETGVLGFWMKNTILPLDLLFISEDGEIRAILQGEPYSTDTISPGPGEPARFVLELNAGTAGAHGIEVGDRVSHPVVDAVSAK